MTEHTFSFGAGQRGIWLGLGGSRLTILGGGCALAALAGYAGLPIPFAVLVVVAAAVWCLAPIGGATPHEWAGPALAHLTSACAGTAAWPAVIPQLTSPARQHTLRLPREMGGLRLIEVNVDGIPVALAAERARRGWELTGVFSTAGPPSIALADPEEQARCLAAWGEALAALAQQYAGRSRLQWVDRVTPYDPGRLQSWMSEHANEKSSAEADDYIALVDEAGTAAVRRVTYVAVQLFAQSRNLDSASDEAIAMLRLAASRLLGAELVTRPLDLSGISAVLRSFIDPCFAGVPAEGQIAPFSRKLHWEYVRTDDTLHRTFAVADWPRIPVGPTWLTPLLLAAPDGTGRTVSVHLEPIPATIAARRARAARLTLDLDAADRARFGFIQAARSEQAQAHVIAADEELASGHAQHRLGAVVTVSAPSLDRLDTACREVVSAASTARLDLRPLHGAHAEGWAASLPLARLRHRSTS